MNDDLVVRLRQKAEYHAREAERYRVAASVLEEETRGSRSRSAREGDRGERVPADPRQSSMAMVELALNESGQVLHPTALVEEMLRRGWQTTAKNPVNTVRTAAHRLVEQGRIQRFPDGNFGRLGLPSPSAHRDRTMDAQPSKDDPAVDQRPVQKPSDPWASVSDPWAAGGSSPEEPPF